MAFGVTKHRGYVNVPTGKVARTRWDSTRCEFHVVLHAISWVKLVNALLLGSFTIFTVSNVEAFLSLGVQMVDA